MAQFQTIPIVDRRPFLPHSRRRNAPPEDDDALAVFQDSLQSFPPEQFQPIPPAPRRTILQLSGGDHRRPDTWADRAVWVVVAVIALALIAGAAYAVLE